jgi:hypothetical protein
MVLYEAERSDGGFIMHMTRRGFLKGLAGTAVIVATPLKLPPAAEPMPPPVDVLGSAKAPDGLTYQWVRTHLLGEPDIENVEARINNGWSFVAPKEQPHLPTEDAVLAIEQGGLILMQKATELVEAEKVAAYEANMIRAGKMKCSTCGEFRCKCEATVLA